MVWPCVRGIAGLISATTTGFCANAACITSQDTPSENVPSAAGAERCSSRISAATTPDANSAGACDSGQRMKSTKPARKARRTARPGTTVVKRKAPLFTPATNPGSPTVTRSNTDSGPGSSSNCADRRGGAAHAECSTTWQPGRNSPATSCRWPIRRATSRGRPRAAARRPRPPSSRSPGPRRSRRRSRPSTPNPATNSPGALSRRAPRPSRRRSGVPG